LKAPPDTTIETLKLQIFQETSLDPLFQKLLYKNTVLDSLHKTLSDYAVESGSIIQLEILDENNIDYSSLVIYDTVNYDTEEGFKGSYLHNDDQSEDEENIMDNQDGWACSNCTYINTNITTCCAVCKAGR